MTSDGHNAPLPRWRGRRGLIACQVAVSAGLVSVAVLCGQQLIALARHDTGIDVDRIAVVRLLLQKSHYDEALGRRVLQEIYDSARRLPGIESVALSSGFPIDLGGRLGNVGVSPDQLSGGYYELIVSTPEVFRTWGVEIRQGRRFDDRDSAATERVTVLTESLSRNLFPHGDAIGRQVFVRFSRIAEEPVRAIETATVIGIAADTDAGDVGNRGGGFLYLPWSQHYQPTAMITLRTVSDPSSLIDPVKRIITRVDPDLAVLDAAPASALGSGRSLVLKVGAEASGLLGWLSLVLAMAGLTACYPNSCCDEPAKLESAWRSVQMLAAWSAWC